VYAAVVGPIGVALCVISFALIVWAVRHVRDELGAARRLGRLMIGTSALAFPILMWVALPRYFEPTFGLKRPVFENIPDELLVLVAASVAYLVGLAWMIWIYRTSHVEPDASSWRYRDSLGYWRS
jgi:hypothetical protein